MIGWLLLASVVGVAALPLVRRVYVFAGGLVEWEGSGRKVTVGSPTSIAIISTTALGIGLFGAGGAAISSLGGGAPTPSTVIVQAPPAPTLDVTVIDTSRARLIGSAYAGDGTHASSSWKIGRYGEAATCGSTTSLVASLTDADSLTARTLVSNDSLKADSVYVGCGQYTDENGTSGWSDTTAFTLSVSDAALTGTIDYTDTATIILRSTGAGDSTVWQIDEVDGDWTTLLYNVTSTSNISADTPSVADSGAVYKARVAHYTGASLGAFSDSLLFIGGVGVRNPEPVFDAAIHDLIAQENFDTFPAITDLLAAGDSGTHWDRGGAQAGSGDSIYFVTGRGDTGNAVRLNYDYNLECCYDLDFNLSINRTVGSWNGTLPEAQGPFHELIWQMWFRFSVDANPTSSGNSIALKGWEFWFSGGRYEWAIRDIICDSGGSYSGSGDDYGGIFQIGSTNRCSEMNAPVNLTYGSEVALEDGDAPAMTNYNDGEWHKVTFCFATETAVGAQNGNVFGGGERIWVDGELLVDARGRVPYATYGNSDQRFLNAITMLQVLDTNSGPGTSIFDFDTDDWMVWTRSVDYGLCGDTDL